MDVYLNCVYSIQYITFNAIKRIFICLNCNHLQIDLTDKIYFLCA